MPIPEGTSRELSPDRRSQPPALPPAEDVAVQRRRMLIALAVLLVALIAVVAKDWDFWFPAADDTQEASGPRRKAAFAPVTPSAAVPTVARPEKKTAKPVEQSPPAFAATTERAALPPLQVEVVAGNRHTAVSPKNPAIRLDLDSGAASTGETSASSKTPSGAADRVQLSPMALQSVTVSVPPDYPMLARQAKVQGAVIMQALISRDGAIQELQVMSGPGILATAAREAVKQWRFKPYLQGGQPVETQARITVNFTISTN